MRKISRKRRIFGMLAIALSLAVAPLMPAFGAIDDLLASSSLLQQGQRNPLVADLQQALSQAGHNPGPVDGIFGSLTRSAVTSFQASKGITVDGLVGSQTRNAIASALGKVPGQASTSSQGSSTTSSVSRSTLYPGSRGPSVAALQRELQRTGFYRGPIDGDFGPMTSSAVMAFHKVWDLERSTTWYSNDWGRIDGWYPRAPGYGSAAYRVEVDLSRQVLFVVRGGSVAAVMPVSSGNGQGYTNYAGNWVTARTPRGNFTVQRHVSGWDISYLGELYEPWYFYGGYAIHGSYSVPGYPASHGCVRVSISDALWMNAHMWVGMPVHVWD